jgi:putative cardiolipin synthase
MIGAAHAMPATAHRVLSTRAPLGVAPRVQNRPLSHPMHADGPWYGRSMDALARMLVLAALLVLAACAGLPEDAGRMPSHALPADPSHALNAMVDEVVPPGPESGFALLPVSSVAFATRLELARRAESTLDVQYYVFQADPTGLSLMRELRDAAQRGVRVRILIDDLYTTGEDEALYGLSTYPNIEIRLFNPFVEGRSSFLGRLLLAASDSSRVNHRMHNKLFIADNAMAVAGGRNVADEYFMYSAESNFVDLDLFIAGPLVSDLESIFDVYWNSSYVYPLAAIVEQPADPARVRADFDRSAGEAQGPPREELPPPYDVWGHLPEELTLGHLHSLKLARAEAFADPVDKASGTREDSLEGTVIDHVLHMMNAAVKEVRITSPYFVPGESGLAMMKAGHDRGGLVTVLTNSLASTDAPAAEAGYAQYRKPMLEAGVELRELSPMLTRKRRRLGNFGASLGSLHAKVVTIDGKILYMGSMNLDPRSARHNTELGMLIYSPALTEEVNGLMDEKSLYHLRLSPAGQVQWVAETDEGEFIYDVDPETTWWRRTKALILSWMVPESLL